MGNGGVPDAVREVLCLWFDAGEIVVHNKAGVDRFFDLASTVRL